MEEQAWYLDTPLCSFTNLFLQREQVIVLSLVWVCSCCLISAALMNLFWWLELLCWIVFIWTFVPLHSICRSDPNYDNNDKVFPNASNLMDQAWCQDTLILFIYEYLFTMETAEQIIMVWAGSYWINSAASTNIFSQYEQLNGFYFKFSAAVPIVERD